MSRYSLTLRVVACGRAVSVGALVLSAGGSIRLGNMVETQDYHADRCLRKSPRHLRSGDRFLHGARTLSCHVDQPPVTGACGLEARHMPYGHDRHYYHSYSLGSPLKGQRSLERLKELSRDFEREVVDTSDGVIRALGRWRKGWRPTS
jgi:hypothetical protein